MDIICLSHLKWEETLFQRPQQIMLRMARHSRVLYFASCGTREYWAAVRSGNRAFVSGRAGENLFYRNVPFPPLSRRFAFLRSFHLGQIVRSAREEARRLGFGETVAWVYYPSFVDHLEALPHARLVYDCMDHFSGFCHSDRRVVEQEERLLRRADLVFTGGRSLHGAKQGINPRTHCFPSGVDYAHFHQAALEDTAIPPDIASIPKPILGYYGAIDERIDYELIRHICKERPGWSVVLIGPVIGGGMPEMGLSNFHHLGKKRYAELPGYLKAFDVCLMPFVRSELTDHISPTKTPEYLAGGKPVVSTPIPDVVADYGDTVLIADDKRRFVECVEAALSFSRVDGGLRFEEKAQGNSWDAIVRRMVSLLEEFKMEKQKAGF